MKKSAMMNIVRSETRFPIIGKCSQKVSNHWKRSSRFFQSLETFKSVFPTIGNVKMAVLLASCMAISAQAQQAEPEEEMSRWSFRVGPAYRMGMSVKASGGAYSDTLEGLSYWPGANGGGWNWANGYLPDASKLQPVADDMGVGDRTFDNGFNNIAICTLSPDPALHIPDNQTWNWSYDADSQFDGANYTMSYTRHTVINESGSSQNVGTYQSVRSYRDYYGTNIDACSDFDAPGLQAELDYLIYTNAATNLAVTLSLGFEMFWGPVQHFQSNTVVGSVSSSYYYENQSIPYTYAMNGDLVDNYMYDVYANYLPGAPYAGTYNGPGPLLFNTPLSRDTIINQQDYVVVYGTPVINEASSGSSSVNIWNDVDIDADMNLYSLWLGPKLYWDASENWSLIINPRLSINYMVADAHREESLYAGSAENPTLLKRWVDDATDDEWAWGAGISVGLDYDVNTNWFVGVSIAYDWISSDLDMTIGPNCLSFDGSGFNGTIQIGRRF